MKNNLMCFYNRRLNLIALLMILATSLFAQDTTEQINPLTKNDPSQYKKPYVILISADGFRADFAEKYDAKFLQTISEKGVRAKYMQPSYPSVTFPNHYTIVTGLYPAHHGLVDNTYIDVASGQQYSMANKKWYPKVNGMAERLYGFWQNNKKCLLPAFIG
jgi:predicted AlkP superfamily pyrophosphatase or phosphodiesterase